MTAFQISTVVDFNVLTAGQSSQDTQLNAIAAVKAEMTAQVQPFLDKITETQAQLVLDQEAIVAAQTILDAANAKLVQDQILADAAVVIYQDAAQDLNAWTAAEADIVDDAATVATLQSIYIKNGGTV